MFLVRDTRTVLDINHTQFLRLVLNFNLLLTLISKMFVPVVELFIVHFRALVSLGPAEQVTKGHEAHLASKHPRAPPSGL